MIHLAQQGSLLRIVILHFFNARAGKFVLFSAIRLCIAVLHAFPPGSHFLCLHLLLILSRRKLLLYDSVILLVINQFILYLVWLEKFSAIRQLLLLRLLWDLFLAPNNPLADQADDVFVRRCTIPAVIE